MSDADRCPVCDGRPRVLLAMRHVAMLRFTRELLEREFGCWVATEASTGASLARRIRRHTFDVVVVDGGDFPACCVEALSNFPCARVIVIGPEPDSSYRAAALADGAGAWLPRDRIADDLGRELRLVLRCRHDPCPPTERVYPRTRESASATDGRRAPIADDARRGDPHEHR